MDSGAQPALSFLCSLAPQPRKWAARDKVGLPTSVTCLPGVDNPSWASLEAFHQGILGPDKLAISINHHTMQSIYKLLI